MQIVCRSSEFIVVGQQHAFTANVLAIILVPVNPSIKGDEKHSDEAQADLLTSHLDNTVLI